MANEKHVVMKHSLAKALLDAGVQHFDSGGTTQGGIGGLLTPQNQFVATAPAITTQPGLVPQISTLQARNENIYNQQQNLAQALLAQSQGVGPNPAMSALNQRTGENVANTAALIASARGAGGNPGQVARNAAMIGANTQQQAVGQGATLQAQQQIAEQNALQTLLAGEAGNALQGQSIGQGALAAENSALTTGQLGTSQINATIAQQNANNAASTTGGLISGIGSAVGGLAGGLGKSGTRSGNPGGGTPTDSGAFTEPGGQTPSGVAPASEPVPSEPIDINSDAYEIGQLHGDSNSSSSDMPDSEWHGGQIPNYDEGGIAQYATPIDPREMLNMIAPTEGTGVTKAFSSLGDVLASSQKKSAGGPIDFRAGGPVDGKAMVSGDSPKNDTVPAMLSPGEDVLPRSVTMAPDAPERAKKFVEALQAKQGKGDGYGKILKARASLKDRVERLEKMCMGGAA